eukprot:1177263-Prorocentrum_minimum.AAC.4
MSTKHKLRGKHARKVRSRPYQAISSLENSILPPILYERHMSVSSPTWWRLKILGGTLLLQANVETTLEADRLACDPSRARGESSGRKWGTGHRVRKGEGSPGCSVHPCRYWHRRTRERLTVYLMTADGVQALGDAVGDNLARLVH